MKIKDFIIQVQKFIDEAGFVEVRVNEENIISLHKCVNDIHQDIVLDNNIYSESKVMILKYVASHNVKFTNFNTEIIKDLISKLS